MAKGRRSASFQAVQAEVQQVVTPEQQAAQLKATLRLWTEQPETFFYGALGVRLTNQQIGFLHVIRDMVAAKVKANSGKRLSEKKREYFGALEQYSEKDLAGMLGISVHSAKGLGKDFTVAGLSLWELLCFPDFKGLVTAPTAKQLDDVYTSEVKRLVRDSKAQLNQFFDLTRGGIYLKSGKQRDGGFITKRTAVLKGTDEEQGETLAGLHSDYMILKVDEASGLPDGCFKPLETTLTGLCNFALLIGNVTRGHGYYYRTHYSEDDRGLWVRLRWDAEESDLDEVRGNTALAQQIDRIARKYGRDSNPFRINVKGLPPLSDANALIPQDWIEDAIGRDVEPTEMDPWGMGVDVGRGGDESAITVRHGLKVIKTATLNVRDLTLVAQWVRETALEMEENPDFICIDTAGLGSGVYDMLLKDPSMRVLLEKGCTLHEVNFAERPSLADKFRNARAEAYWRLREAFEKRTISIPQDEEMKNELSVIKVEDWEPKIFLKSKKKMLSEGLASPNRADSLALSFYVNTPSRVEVESVIDKYRRKMKLESQGSWMTV